MSTQMQQQAAAHIIVVDDDDDVRNTVAEYLLRNGFAVSEANGGEALRARMAERPIDLALLDINMPGDDGLTLAREIRASGDAGIIMLTAKNDDIDRIVGLEIGADDYITKPFNPRELLARVRSVLRRARASAGGEAPATMGREVQMGKCRLNLDSRKLYCADGSEQPLTAMEFDLLATFAAHPGRVLSRDQLLDLAHNKEIEPFDRSIDIRVTRIRRKIEDDPAKPQAIKTVRGAGYVFTPRAGG
ncbi:MAG TPA: response regulator [Allosphingosinicella sp.]|nr:response regulator [Allosphingosinicella sp.]